MYLGGWMIMAKKRNPTTNIRRKSCITHLVYRRSIQGVVT